MNPCDPYVSEFLGMLSIPHPIAKYSIREKMSVVPTVNREKKIHKKNLISTHLRSESKPLFHIKNPYACTAWNFRSPGRQFLQIWAQRDKWFWFDPWFMLELANKSKVNSTCAHRGLSLVCGMSVCRLKWRITCFYGMMKYVMGRVSGFF